MLKASSRHAGCLSSCICRSPGTSRQAHVLSSCRKISPIPPSRRCVCDVRPPLPNPQPSFFALLCFACLLSSRSPSRQAALRLRAGCNTVEFVVNVAGQAERVVSARAFLWGSGAKVVVSDIENTIARRLARPFFLLRIFFFFRKGENVCDWRRVLTRNGSAPAVGVEFFGGGGICLLARPPIIAFGAFLRKESHRR